ncbi:hypothetical protein KM908_14280 [Alkalihalobacillus clausii]|uniref:hypothetical protein n=1 Tax=Shouchella clausii TaxID=79880 RepID=UPI001C23A799|nr:hypothetical protein [Shouchella clausii]MBU8597309.1 hypothetical protein [Shouchella clausii]
MSKFLLVYIAVILGVATYFYMRRKLRKWRGRREERLKSYPTIFYLYRYDGYDHDSMVLMGVFTNREDANKERDKLRKIYSPARIGLYWRKEKRFIKDKEARR